MKKTILFLSALITLTASYKAQQTISPSILQEERFPLPSQSINSFDEGTKLKSSTVKLFGDTLFYEDFDGGIPTGWSIVNNNANNFIWQWDTIYKQGMFSTNANAINSTTASNGFMSLPADFYNTPLANGGAPMDTYFQSDTINIPTNTNSVWVSYQQYFRYCCSSANRLVLQVSTDNFTSFTEFDATDAIAVNQTNASDSVAVANNIINISCALQGDTVFKIRFLSSGNTHYFWMIDDIAVIEGPHNDIELNNRYIEFNYPRYFYNPFYHQIPHDLFTPLSFSADIKNNGDYTQTNVRLEVGVTHTSFPNNTSGAGLVYFQTDNTFGGGTIPGNYLLACDNVASAIVNNPTFVPFQLGNFDVDWFANSDSLDQNLLNGIAIDSFLIGDTIFARDDNSFGGGTGPASYVNSNGTPGGTSPGDRFGSLFVIESRSGNGVHTIPSSVTFRVSGNPSNLGAEIIPKIWKYNEDSLANGINAAFGSEVASSFIPYTINVIDTFITLTFDNGSALTNGLDSGQYVVGWESTSIAGGTSFEVLNDASSAARQRLVSTFLYFGHDPGWSWVRDNPGIRLNMKNLPLFTSLKQPIDSNLEISILPNPSKGEFNLNFKAEKQDLYEINIQNAIGQTVYHEEETVVGIYEKQINLKNLEKGIYFVVISNSTDRRVEKIVIN